MKQQTIVLVEDDSIIAELLDFNLTGEGYVICSFRDGAALFRELSQIDSPSLFILDVMLPDMDGLEICRRLRNDPRYEIIPILMLTARGTENDKVKGLDTGADDYLTKPFSMRELLARVNAQTRRGRKMPKTMGTDLAPHDSQPADAIHPGRIDAGDIVLDDVRHRVFNAGKEIEMTNREYELLKYLMIHRGVAFSRDELLDRVWGYEYGGETRTVDVHIRQLRRKIEKNDAEPVLIETVRGRGYRWTDQI